jgi:predicted small lipoprotein YifL
MKFFVLLLSILVVCVSLTACGVKKNLKLPKDDPKKQERVQPKTGGAV